MKTTLIVPLLIALAVLLIFSVYVFNLVFWGPAVSDAPNFCPFCSSEPLRYEDNQRRRMGPGMMGMG